MLAYYRPLLASLWTIEPINIDISLSSRVAQTLENDPPSA